MPRRKVVLANNEYYHVYNRSTGAIPIFDKMQSLERIISLIDYYRYPQELRHSKYSTLPKELKKTYETSFRKLNPTVEMYSFSFMSNHYHLLIKQNSDDGIARFVSNIQNSFAKYFNSRNKRFGSLFQGPFKAKHVDMDSYLLHLSRYIHLNPITSYIINIDELYNYPWTSFPFYINKKTDKVNLINTSFIIKMVGSKSKYKKFVYDQEDYQKKLGKIKGLIIEQPR